VTSSSTVVAALEAARDKKAPLILQISQGGAAYFAGKVLFLIVPEEARD
jgi:fructose-bisphosphate aldolase class II